MKSILLSIFFMMIFLSQHNAAQAFNIAIENPTHLYEGICPTKKWKDIEIYWEGVSDTRKSQHVAVINQKNKETIYHQTENPLEQYFKESLPLLLKKCGFVLLTKPNSKAYSVSAEIAHFEASMDKTLLKSQISAKSTLILKFKNRQSAHEVNTEFFMESKGVNFKSTKRLTALIQDLYLGTLKQLIQTKQIDFL